MSKNALVFLFENSNKQTISVLIGALESERRFDNLDIHLLRPRAGLGEKIEALAAGYDQVVVGFSFTTPRVPQVFETVRRVRDHLQSRRVGNVMLVAGGPHPSGDWRGTLDMGFDIAVVGEGEKSFPRLLTALYERADFGMIRGLAYRNDSEMRFTGHSERVASLDDYPPFAAHFGLFSSIEITRGCPCACRYCQTTFLLGGRMRHRSIENIIHWVEVSKRCQKPEIRFITPDAFAYGSKNGKELRLDLLAEMLEGVNQMVGREHTYIGSFPSEVRPDHVSREAADLVRRFAANDNLVIGAQSGSQRLLDLARRGHSVEDIYRAVRLTHEAGLTAIVDFIFGMPGETEEDQALTRQTIQDLAAMGARIHSHAFIPLAGTPWANAPTGKVDPQTQIILERLTGRGQQFGQWREQQNLASKGS
jgi:B12-binding domain/radical SAM domain protein